MGYMEALHDPGWHVCTQRSSDCNQWVLYPQKAMPCKLSIINTGSLLLWFQA